MTTQPPAADSVSLSDAAVAQAFRESENEWFQSQSESRKWVEARARELDALTNPEADAGGGEHLRRLVGKLAQWQLCMSYNDSYFGEPAGLMKQVVAELTKAVDPIYPPAPVPVDPLAGVNIYIGAPQPTTKPCPTCLGFCGDSGPTCGERFAAHPTTPPAVDGDCNCGRDLGLHTSKRCAVCGDREAPCPLCENRHPSTEHAA